jgi:hypothetical protein
MGDCAANEAPIMENQKMVSECGSQISGVDVMKFIVKRVAQKIDQSKKLGYDELEITRSLSGVDALEYLSKKRHDAAQRFCGPWKQRDLFLGRPEYVPNNSDVESNPF